MVLVTAAVSHACSCQSAHPPMSLSALVPPCLPPPPPGPFPSSGDIVTLAECIRDCEDVNTTIDLPNQQQHRVCGVTPLYLAAQAGHKQACVLLVQAGADVLQTCAVPESGDVFGPADIALVHFNLACWYYLLGVKRQRLNKVSARHAFEEDSQIAEPLIAATEQQQLVM